jgi:hypothetical protein
VPYIVAHNHLWAFAGPAVHTVGNIPGSTWLCGHYLYLYKVVLLVHKCSVSPDAQLPPLFMVIPHCSFCSIQTGTSDDTHLCCWHTHTYTYLPWILTGWQPFVPRKCTIIQVLFGWILYVEHVHTIPICSQVPTVLSNLCFMCTAMWSHATGHIW